MASPVNSKEKSELLGVSVGYIAGQFAKSVEEVFGPGADPNFYQINAAMLLGDGPREVHFRGLEFSSCKVGQIIFQRAGGDTIQGFIKEVHGDSMVVIETGTCYNPNEEFKEGVTLIHQEKELGIPPVLERHTLPGWPLGKRLECPRDGQPNCSLVDALAEKGPSGSVSEANVYLSWAWKYKLSAIVGGIVGWCRKEGLNKDDTFIWICAFNNNQYRVQSEKEANRTIPFEAFKEIFETRIKKINRVVSLLDSWAAPVYVQRLWCDLELAMALQLKIPVEIILPVTEERNFISALTSQQEDAFNAVWQMLGSVQVQNATATLDTDKANILAVIQEAEGGFDIVNAAVRDFMQCWLISTVMHAADTQEHAKPHAAVLLSRFGRSFEALEIQEQVLELRRRILPEDHPDIASAMADLAASYRKLGRLDDAVKIQEEVLELRRRIRHPKIATAMATLAASYHSLGRLDDAVKMKEEVLQMGRRILPEDHPDIASAMGNLAVSYHSLGRLDDAVKIQEEVLELRRRILPEDHPDTASAMAHLAASYRDLGRLDDAVKIQEEVLEMRRRILPEDHPDIASAMANLAASYQKLGRLDDAVKIQEEVLEMRRRILPEGHPKIATAMAGLAVSYHSLGRLDDAVKMKEEVLELRRRILPEDHPDIASAMTNLAASYRKLGRLDDAVKIEEEVLELRRGPPRYCQR